MRVLQWGCCNEGAAVRVVASGAVSMTECVAAALCPAGGEAKVEGDHCPGPEEGQQHPH